ncbi:pentatricopeptide repeat protein [Aspergillus uvarum CBS 121591]|uniref:Pentatricopeptide repeat protein n=1 Tax=Aspergillus uvarum CBS 121591 TaxID=1448315 RepID=A0A319CNX7_9EURO|nr:pentatricopeptide repeat protein [Aspergillus uvarum CBS 121591]PYH80463.1 pentatricopeptide repeat protein [Aspergillus uvarum CBS 121591]
MTPESAAAARGTTTPAVPSRNALRVLRRLALAGSTVGGFCTIAAVTYDVHRRVTIAERIVENKRALHASAPNYDATAAARRLARMMEAAEAGEFMGLESLKDQDRRAASQTTPTPTPTPEVISPPFDRTTATATATSSSFQDMYIPLPGVGGGGSSPALAEKLLRDTRPGPMNPQMQTPGLADGLGSLGSSGSSGSSANEIQKAAPSTLGDSLTDEKALMDTLDNQPVTWQMQWLLTNDRPVYAAQLFLDKHPETHQHLAPERRQLAEQVFFANCTAGNVHLARNVFERVEAVDQVSFEMWRTMILTLAKKGAIESAAAIYTRYMHRFKASPEMIDIVLRCLVESHRLTTAKWFLLRNLQYDRGCGLCGAYLTGLWRKTRSIELLNGQLSKLLRVLMRLGKKPTDKLFNPVIKAYVEFGRLADAEALANEMTVNHGIPPRCRTKGLLLLGKALQCDWEGVRAGFEEMHKLRLVYRVADFIPVFDRIFLEYWPTHTAEEIRTWLYGYLTEFEIVPDRVLYKHILEALVQKGDRDMVYDFLRFAKERKWPKLINEFAFLEMLRSQRHALEHSPIGFWQMLQAARMKYGQAAASQRILGYDQHSFPSPEVNKMPFTEDSLPFFQRMQQETQTSRPVDQYQKVHRLMAHYMHNGKFVEALKRYEAAKAARFHFKQVHVELAAIATIIEKGIEAARELIDSNWRSIRNVTRFLPQFFRQVTEIDTQATNEHIKLAVFRFYEICSSGKDMTVKHHMLVALCRRLIHEDKPDLALELLSAIYMSRYRHTLAFDGPCLKMFLRAFTLADNPLGVRWCLMTALTWPKIDTDFTIEVRRIIGRLRHRTESNLTNMHYMIEREEYLTHVADMVIRKVEGKDASTTSDVIHNPRLKRSKRNIIKRPPTAIKVYRLEEVDKAVAEWDEEYELHAALGQIQNVRVRAIADLTEEQYLEHEWKEGDLERGEEHERETEREKEQ